MATPKVLYTGTVKSGQDNILQDLKSWCVPSAYRLFRILGSCAYYDQAASKDSLKGELVGLKTDGWSESFDYFASRSRKLLTFGLASDFVTPFSGMTTHTITPKKRYVCDYVNPNTPTLPFVTLLAETGVAVFENGGQFHRYEAVRLKVKQPMLLFPPNECIDLDSIVETEHLTLNMHAPKLAIPPPRTVKFLAFSQNDAPSEYVRVDHIAGEFGTHIRLTPRLLDEGQYYDIAQFPDSILYDVNNSRLNQITAHQPDRGRIGRLRDARAEIALKSSVVSKDKYNPAQ